MFKKKAKQEILQTYKRVKSSIFDFARICQFFSNKDHSDAHQIISYSTLQDLDFEELFMFMDRTCSKIGQQYLYSTLRCLPKTRHGTLRYEKIINYLNEHPAIKESAVLQLSRLDDPGAYYLQSLMYNGNIVKPNWYWLIILLSGLSIFNLALSFFFPVFILAFIPILTINFVIHYWNKKNILTYSNSVPQLLILNQVVHSLINSGVILDKVNQVKNSYEAIKEISKSAIFYRVESKLNSELGQAAEFILELIKALFLLEPLFLFKMVRELELKKSDISIIFHAVAQVDVAISISSLRESLPYYTIPEITDQKKHLHASELYHPLILNPVANTIDLSDGKSVIISGSNMSGKTTFIRTIGINTILSQTINTACAKKFTIPLLKVHSAIKISDDLLDDTSYYYKEVKTIKKMISESESGFQNLFLLDEIFKGTNTIERIASGKAVLSFLNHQENLVFVSTHDLELTDLLSNEYSNFHFTESIENDSLTFDYQLKSGSLVNTNAIKILEINKFPQEITKEAKILAKQFRQK